MMKLRILLLLLITSVLLIQLWQVDDQSQQEVHKTETIKKSVVQKEVLPEVEQNEEFVSKDVKEVKVSQDTYVQVTSDVKEALSEEAQVQTLSYLQSQKIWTGKHMSALQDISKSLRVNRNEAVLEGLYQWSKGLELTHPAQSQLISMMGDFQYMPSQSWLSQTFEQSSDSYLQSECLLSLAQMGDEQVESMALAWINSDHADQRESALAALSLIGTKASVEVLNQSLSSFSYGDKNLARHAIQQIQQRY